MFEPLHHKPQSRRTIDMRNLPMRSLGFGAIVLAALALAAPGVARASEGEVKHEEKPRISPGASQERSDVTTRPNCAAASKFTKRSAPAAIRSRCSPSATWATSAAPLFQWMRWPPSRELQDQGRSQRSRDYFERPGRASDRFPPPFANEQAARAALGGGYPPDMSVLAKARGYSRGFPTFLFDAIPGFSYQEHGVDYIASLLQGYQDAPKDVKIPDGQYYNIYMPGRRIGMIPPLVDGSVTYDDKTPQTIEQYAQDVAAS